ncbi:MAG: glycosyltransferase [Gammaproteobacteria bacterium]
MSILMNCYNGVTYLKEAIDSIYSQYYQDWEIIFIDNCSTDGSADILNSYDNRIKYYLTSETLPLGKARNFGLKKCYGEYIAFLDTDDIWLPQKLEKQIKNMDAGSYDIGYSAWASIDENGKLKKIHYLDSIVGDNLRCMLRRYQVNFQTVILKNTGNLQFDETLKYSPDYKLFLQVAVNNKILVQNDVLVKYRIHDHSLSKATMASWGFEAMKAIESLEKNNNLISQEYSKEIKIAKANALYKNARYYMEEERNLRRARDILSKIKGIKFKFTVLFWLSMSPAAWSIAHRLKKY